MARGKKRTRKAASSEDTHREEIAGLITAALGIFFIVCIFAASESSAAGLVGMWIRDRLFGLFGFAAYPIPFGIVALGVLIIINSHRPPRWHQVLLWSAFGLSVLSFVSVFFLDEIAADTFGSFVASYYDLGWSKVRGCGALSAIPLYPVRLYLGRAGAYLFFATVILSVAIIKTRLSLRAMGNGIRDLGARAVATARDYHQRARSLYVEDLDKPARGSETPDLRLIDSSVFSSEPPRIVDHELNAVPAHGAAPEPEAAPGDIPEFLRPYHRRGAAAPGEPIEQITILPDTEPEIKPRAATPGSRAKAEPVELSVAAPPPREYVFPPIELLRTGTLGARGSRDDYLENARKLENTLLSFGITAKVIQISRGPVITRYELQPAPGVKISRIVNLSNDIALNMAARGVRIEAPIPGKAAIGIEIANTDISTVFLRDVIESSAFTQSGSKLTVCLGKDIAGKNIVTDLAKMPHLMIAGATGSGKSVCINCLIISLLYKARPDEVRLIMVDPKVVELSVYNGIPHLLIPVVTDPKKAAGALNWAVQEMTRRYQLFAEKKARDLARYNQLAEEAGEEPLPQIVIIIDELADLMVVAPTEVEDAICRLAQMARAAGMHLVIATQRPSVDVITGVIKANIPSRIAFAVYSQTDSRTILDMGGAEKLLGRGDMLFHPSSSPKPVRVQGAFVDEPEVESVVSFIRGAQEESEYDEEIIRKLESFSGEESGESEEMGPQGLDELITDAIEVVHEQGQASISMMQRRLRVGYARAARLVDEMEQMGIIGPADGSKPRPILKSRMESLAIVNGTDRADEL